ncbi:TerB family tellurite resistance protein [Psychroserpens sp.]|uniref:TerB family tellurite resistance protein n=1 Tax=Psychroserpens sp. TaxID=2020870 RepID=UPI001B01582E|nr:TerB family tellurite resistance protein [Psychroserpens sp.]MBO6607712.1 TerB family tellurite resistance protein [Psychroserpens sp.]MBO6631092.1 TerB family tellurite resistance protein [Psychroserpens sp.]MBO6654703.1 TerB family tellurite resistance protein [Psychroserpens sp.]MBO6682873.1 TerB family tellurite resistance protein [Psychroserpens sp.]MBO6751070.1 TerB family tellurite resistance protein [Psychroserpens sp.]
MSFSELFESGFKKRNENHFAAIVRVAMSDGIINDAEKAFLDRLATRLDITETEYKQILKDYQSHPINPPLSYDSRLERLYDLARMVWADHIEGENQVRLLEKLCIGLGFNPENVKYITDKALTLVHYEVELDEFIDRMRNMNQ